MKNTILVSLIIIVIVNSAFSQQVKYNKIATYKTHLSWSEPVEFLSPLYIGNEESCFILYKANKGVQEMNEYEETFYVKLESKYPEFFITKYNKNQIYFLGQNFNKNYLVLDTEHVEWKILNNSKKIGAYSCQEAVAYFRGRKYSVWYSSDIAKSLGPWKLRGLPGLIFEVSDSTGDVSFRLVSIKNESGILNLEGTALPQVTWEEFTKKFRKSWNHFFSYLKSYESEDLHVNISNLELLEPSIMRNEK